jgi:predicted metalloprotease
VLQSNKLYAAGKVGAVKCPLPGDRLVSAPAVTRYVRAVLACLDQAWAPVVKRAGFRFHPPVLHIFKKTVESPCTGPSADAFYCGESDGIYLDWTSDQVLGLDQFNTQMDLIYTASHEYGHHIQELSGIMRYYDSHFDDKPYKAQLEESRRLELQADCFAAAFLRGNEQTLYLLGSRYWALNLGSHGDDNDPRSPRDHGSTNSNHRWAADTFASGGDLASCNTWTAPAEYVS